MDKETIDLFKLLSREGKRKSWVGNRADPTQVTSYEWDVPTDNGGVDVELIAIYEVELKINNVRISYGTDTPVGKLADFIFGMLEGIYHEEYMEPHFFDSHDSIDWATVAAHLQDRGYFTRYCRVQNDEWLEVCTPGNNCHEEDVIRDLEGIDLKVKELDPHGHRDYSWCRLEAR